MSNRATPIPSTETPVPAAPTETITVSMDDLNALIELKLEERMKAMEAAAAQTVVEEPTPIGPRWTFLHESAPGFAVPLPKEMRDRTEDGFLRFKPDWVTVDGKRSRHRPRRGKFITTDPEIGEWLTSAVLAGKFPGLHLDTKDNRMKLQQDEIAYLSA